MRKLQVSFIVLLLLAQSLLAQEEKLYPFAHYNFNNGLAAYNANTIVQDERGFIWIGTINGLQRFDGHTFITFRRIPGNTRSLSDNYIDHLFLDSKQNLWLVLGNGEVGTFDTRRFIFKKVKLEIDDDRTLRQPRRLIEDSDGNLMYIIYGHQVTTYNRHLQEFSSRHNKLRLPPGWRAISVAEDTAAKRFWIGTDSGMCVYDKRAMTISYRGHNVGRYRFIDRFGGSQRHQNIMIDGRSRLWYTVNDPVTALPTINCYNLAMDSVLLAHELLLPRPKSEYEVKRLLCQKDGNVWLTGADSFLHFNEQQHKFVPVSAGIADSEIDFEEINYLFEDREKNIWLTTGNNGVYIFKPSRPQFTSVRHFNRTVGGYDEGGVIALAYDDAGNLLAGVNGDGLHKYDSTIIEIPATSYTADEKQPHTIWSICPLRDKKSIWMGTSAGVVVYDIGSRTSTHHNPPPFANKLVRTVTEDRMGNIWIGLPAAGVFKWKPEKGKQNFDNGFVNVAGLPDNLIEKITVDSKGFVWICTLMNGVYKLDPATDSILIHLTHDGPEGQRLLSDAATDAFEYNDSIMVIPTGALNFYNTIRNTVTPVSSADGLPSDIVRSIEKDSRNNLWLGMFNGLCRMNVERNRFTYYDRNDGMVNDNFNYSSSCRLPDGRLVFGTTTNLIIFDPEQLNISNKPPDVVITEFKVMNRSLSVDSLLRLQKVDLRPDQDFLTIGFSGLSFYPKKWSYLYKMVGLDKEWKNISNQYQVTYNYLPPGKYTFQVRSENADGITSEQLAELKIVVQPPLLRSWWFYSIVILFVALILYLIDKERMRKKEMIEKTRNDIADNLHGEVNTALNKINILSEIARIKVQKEPERASEFFEQIHKKSHDMIVAMDDMLWSIAPENDSMGKTIERLREFIDAMKTRYAASIDLLVDPGIESLAMNMKLRYEMYTLMKGGIQAVVEAGTKNCKVHIGRHKEGLLYTLEISNKNCDLQQLNNLIQQIELEKRLDSIDATLTSEMHKFTSVFDLYVPVK